MGQGTHVPHSSSASARTGGGGAGLGPDDFEQIDRFLTVVGQGSLLEYYDLDPDTPEDEVEAALQARRRWAQGQQANPKYRVESRWIIKNSALIRRALVERRPAYLAELARREHADGLEVLDQFLMGVLSSGRLSVDAEAAVVQRGRGLGLPEAVVYERIEQRLRETGAHREALPTDEVTRLPDLSSEPPPASEETVPGFLDHYQTLGVEADAELSTIEAALRGRYRWARTIRDPNRAARIYDSLDEAWRVLRDRDSRRRYDETRSRHASLPPRSPVVEPDLGLDDDDDLPTAIGTFTVPPLPNSREHRRGPEDMLLGPPSHAVEANPDDLLLGPPPEDRPASETSRARCASGARVGLSQPTMRSGSGARSRLDALPSGRHEETWPSGMLPEGRSSSVRSGASTSAHRTGSTASRAFPSGTRSLPPADTLSDEATRADPVQVEYSPSQSWALYLLGALAVVAVWAVLAIVFGWGRSADQVDPLAPEVDAPAALPAAAPAAADPPGPAEPLVPDEPEASSEPPAGSDLPGDTRAVVEPATPAAAAATPAASTVPAASRPPAPPVEAAPAPPEDAPEPAPPEPADPKEGTDTPEPEAPEGYMGLPDDLD